MADAPVPRESGKRDVLAAIIGPSINTRQRHCQHDHAMEEYNKALASLGGRTGRVRTKVVRLSGGIL